jgi:Tfp pilus assembly protein PilO
MLREFFQNLKPTLKRYLFSSICTALSILLLIAAVLLWLDQRQLNQRVQLRTAQGENVLAALAAGPALRDSLAKVRNATVRINENLVHEPNLAENLWYFYNFESANQVRLSNLQQMITSGGANRDTTYKLIPYALRVTGNYRNVTGFLQSIETGPKLAKIRSFSLSRLDENGDEVSLQLELALLGQP